MSIHDFFGGGDVDLDWLAAYLDGLEPAERVAEARALSAAEQARLFEAAAGFCPVTLDDFVPKQIPSLQQVIHYGRNSLPVFRLFEKRFCRPEKSAAHPKDELWGYNEQRWKSFTGPGYFVAREVSGGEVVIDYCELPSGKAGGWPSIQPSSARLGRFIYNRTRDFLRGVSSHVSIGRATRDAKPMDNWFVLCRE